MEVFDKKELKKLYSPPLYSNGEDNGQITIIGGSQLFHGAPLFSLTVASRICDMVFFASPEPAVGRIAEKIKSKLFSFIWVPWEDTESYIKKSDAVLIGPGFRRFGSESSGEKEKNHFRNSEGIFTRLVTETLIKKFPKKKWVIDAGSLQVLDPGFIPQNSILTPNKKEFFILFNLDPSPKNAKKMSKKYACTIVLKGPETIVTDEDRGVIVKGGNAGMTKGGTGDCLAGLTVALLAKNRPFLAASAASFIIKQAANDLFNKVGVYYNSDDLANQIPHTLHSLTT